MGAGSQAQGREWKVMSASEARQRNEKNGRSGHKSQRLLYCLCLGTVLTLGCVTPGPTHFEKWPSEGGMNIGAQLGPKK
jgi:hypothetical protein